jgi:hypothetical protein
MADYMYLICETQEDFEKAYQLACELAVENNIPVPFLDTWQAAYDRKEILIGKDGDKVIIFNIFHQEGDTIVSLYIGTDKDYRNQGVATAFGQAICYPEYPRRGIKYAISAQPADVAWLNNITHVRAGTFIETKEMGGRLFNIYRRELP